MSTTQEATVNPDGTTTFAEEETTFSSSSNGDEEFNATDDVFEEDDIMMEKQTDPAIYLLLVVLIVGIIGFLIYVKRKKSSKEMNDEFFSQLDGEKFNLKLPAAVDEYYAVKAKVEESGWQPGQPSGDQGQSGPQRVLAQALMKRCIADIPLVTHIQKESAGMNKLYSNSMCSVKQWRSYQAAETLVSSEVDEVRAEAEEIEPGWSQVIWRQAMQYHNMLKQRHEMEAKALAAQAEKKKEEEDKVLKQKKAEDDKRNKELAAERAAQELIKAEEREKESKSAFGNSGGMKKGFLTGGGAKKK